MRWYGTWRWRAARLKNATERCDRLSVTFTLSSRNTSLSGDGRKSSMILTRPISPLLYLTVGFFIDRLSFPPVSRTKNSDPLVSPCKSHRHDSALNPTEAEVALFAAAVIEVFSNHAQRIEKRQLGEFEPDAVLCPIDSLLYGIPLEIGHRLAINLYVKCTILLYGLKDAIVWNWSSDWLYERRCEIFGPLKTANPTLARVVRERFNVARGHSQWHRD